MIRQIGGQRDELLRANEVIDKRRRFTEAVLAGVTAGVLGIDAEGRINLANRSALNLLGAERSDLLGQSVADAVPELAGLFLRATMDGPRPQQEQLTINRYGPRTSAQREGHKRDVDHRGTWLRHDPLTR